MEKIMYLATVDGDIDAFRDSALNSLANRLSDNDNVVSLRMSFSDSAVSRADGLKFENCPPLPQIVVSIFVHTANRQKELLDIICEQANDVEAYLVTESEVMAPPSQPGQRTTGTMQFCTLSQLESLSREEFLTIWRESHGEIACDVQSTFGYRQNLIVRKLTANAKDHTAIVEEHFPEDAMDSPHAFYDAVGDDEKLQENVKAMMDSCARFIDASQINVVHMSEYTC